MASSNQDAGQSAFFEVQEAGGETLLPASEAAGCFSKMQRRTQCAICCGVSFLAFAVISTIGVWVLGPTIAHAASGMMDVTIISQEIPGIVPDGTDGCTSMCGILIKVSAKIHNPAFLGLALGDMNAQLMTDDNVVLGLVQTDGSGSLNVNPGDNVVNMTGKLSPQGAAAMKAASTLMTAYMQNKAQPVKVVGLDAGNNSGKWLHDVADGLEMKMMFPGAGDGFSVLTDIDIQAMSLSLSATNSPMISATIAATMQMPKGVNISIISDVTSADMEFDMVDPDTGKALAHVAVTSDKAQIQYSTGKMTATLSATPMTVTDTAGFEQLVKELMTTPSKLIQMIGTASPTVISNMGTLHLEKTPFSSTADLRGYNAFSNPKTGESLMVVNGIDVVGGGDGSLKLVADCSVTNPSNTAASMGPMTLELWTAKKPDNPEACMIPDNLQQNCGAVDINSPGCSLLDCCWYKHRCFMPETVLLAEMHIANFSVGANSDGTYVTHFPKVAATYTAPIGAGAAAGRRFLSNFVMGLEQPVHIRAKTDGSGTPIALLKPALASFATISVAPGLKNHKLVQRSLMYLPNFLHPKRLPTALVVMNPLATEMVFVATHCEIYPCEELSDDSKKCNKYFPESTGWFTPDENVNEVLPAKSTVTLGKHSVLLTKLLSPAVLKTFFTSASGNGQLIRLKGNMTMSVGGTVMTVDYEQSDVHICLVYPGHNCASTEPVVI